MKFVIVKLYSSAHIPIYLLLSIQFKTCHGTPNCLKLRGKNATLSGKVIIWIGLSVCL